MSIIHGYESIGLVPAKYQDTLINKLKTEHWADSVGEAASVEANNMCQHFKTLHQECESQSEMSIYTYCRHRCCF